MPSNLSSDRPIGSVIMWQPAQTGSVLCAVSRIRAVGMALLEVSWTAVKLTSPGGSGTGWHMSSSRIARPRRVGELRPECE